MFFFTRLTTFLIHFYKNIGHCFTISFTFNYLFIVSNAYFSEKSLKRKHKFAFRTFSNIFILIICQLFLRKKNDITCLYLEDLEDLLLP